MAVPVMTVIFTGISFVTELIKMAQETKMLNEKELKEIKEMLDKEFGDFKTWKEL